MTEELTFADIKPETCFVPRTDKIKGRNISVKPETTAARYLHYGRIILGAEGDTLKFENGDHETGLVCLKGKATVMVDGKSFEFTPYDSIYIPRNSKIEVKPSEEGCDFAEISAPAARQFFWHRRRAIISTVIFFWLTAAGWRVNFQSQILNSGFPNLYSC